MVNQAILTNGNPQADVLFGIDSTFLTRALDEDLFVPYEAEGLDEVDDALLLDPEHRVTPIDYGDVCLNYDKAWFAEHGLPVPDDASRTSPIRRTATCWSSRTRPPRRPGLAFLLATIDAFGEDGWQEWWTDLRANGVQVRRRVGGRVLHGRSPAARASEGTRPLVVSYASSPPAEVIYADPPVDEAPTGVIAAGCYRQVEGAGILAGTDHEAEAGLLRRLPAVGAVPGRRAAVDVRVPGPRTARRCPRCSWSTPSRPTTCASSPPEEIEANREEWIDAWTDLVVR